MLATTQTDNNLFLEQVAKKLGDKVYIGNMPVDQALLDTINAKAGGNVTMDDIVAYGKWAWLRGTDCPICGTPLLGIFGVFDWGYRHGEGYCSSCNKIEFRYYHYFGDTLITLLAVTRVIDQ